MTDAAQSHRRAALVVRVILLLGIVIGGFLLLRKLNLDQLWSGLRHANVFLLALAIFANLLSQVTRALGWNSLLPRPIPFFRLVRYEFTAQAASAVSPEGTGELVRVGLLRDEGVPRTVTVTLMAVRKLFSSLGLVPLLPLVWLTGGNVPSWAAKLAAGYVAVLIMVSVLVLRAARPPADRTRTTRLRRLLFDTRAALGPIRRPRVAAEVAGAAVLTRVLDLAALLIVARSLDVQLSLAVGVFVLLLIEVSGVLPAAPAQLGTFEAAVLLATIGTLDHVDAVALALVFHAQQILPQLPFGVMGIAARRAGRDRPRPQS